ncbi:uncharacterized protein BCR38DRAFT_129209 [Pseudomassariella vexata]|uniref:Uncharacterized protein n=1 Tax=Pseudomassariella vexata TaxID=1141098 RepID=A0A1Y2EA35_9PEZI|nr:uncharacterized protein BCR38DRAFT_129209 [Pseudomassariella vexata]ORY68257.1 hypothetical protein BCR38DRAFT_129209 [Pseudomassariella vexata]
MYVISGFDSNIPGRDRKAIVAPATFSQIETQLQQLDDLPTCLTCLACFLAWYEPCQDVRSVNPEVSNWATTRTIRMRQNDGGGYLCHRNAHSQPRGTSDLFQPAVGNLARLIRLGALVQSLLKSLCLYAFRTDTKSPPTGRMIPPDGKRSGPLVFAQGGFCSLLRSALNAMISTTIPRRERWQAAWRPNLGPIEDCISNGNLEDRVQVFALADSSSTLVFDHEASVVFRVLTLVYRWGGEALGLIQTHTVR